MQLAKQKTRKAPTFHEIKHPRGIRRNDADYNQVNNAQQINRNLRGDSFK